VGHLVAALMVLLLLLLVVVQVGLLLLQVELLQVVVRRLLLLLLVVRRLLLLLVVQGNGHAGRQIRQEASGTAWRGCMPGPRAAAQGRRDAGPASARSWHPHAATHSGVGRQVEQAGRNGRWSRLPVLMLHGRCHLHLLSDVVGHCGHRSGSFLRHVLLTSHSAHPGLRTAAVRTGQRAGRSCQGATCAGVAQGKVLQGKRGLTRGQLVQFEGSSCECGIIR